MSLSCAVGLLTFGILESTECIWWSLYTRCEEGDSYDSFISSPSGGSLVGSGGNGGSILAGSSEVGSGGISEVGSGGHG